MVTGGTSRAVGAGHVAVGIGDVAGRGIRAAAVMGHARAAMRAAGRAALPPAAVLELLDAQLAEVLVAGDPEAPTPQFATACYAIVRPEEGLIRVANAGHMPLLVRGGDGSVRVVAVPPGPPLGLGIGGYGEVDVPFGTGEILAMFTDGLVESRTEDLDVGIGQLAAALGRADPGSSPGCHRGPPPAPDGTPARRQPRRRRVRPAPAGWGRAGADPPTDIGRPRRRRAGSVLSPRAGRT